MCIREECLKGWGEGIPNQSLFITIYLNSKITLHLYINFVINDISCSVINLSQVTIQFYAKNYTLTTLTTVYYFYLIIKVSSNN